MLPDRALTATRPDAGDGRGHHGASPAAVHRDPSAPWYLCCDCDQPAGRHRRSREVLRLTFPAAVAWRAADGSADRTDGVHEVVFLSPVAREVPVRLVHLVVVPPEHVDSEGEDGGQ